MKTQRSTSNPELYATLSAPFETTAEAQAAMVAFLDDVRVAREKHRIGDMLVVPVVTSNEAGGKAIPMVAYFGDQRLAVRVTTEALIELRVMQEARTTEALRALAGVTVDRTADDTEAL